MDAKITKTRLKTMLSYDWLKIVGAIAAAIFVWVMAFTMTATKIIPSQHLVVCSYLGNTSLDQNLNLNLYNQLNEGKLTHETLETETLDLASSRDVAYSLLQARTYVNELDVMFVSKQNDVSTAYQEEGSDAVLYERTYLQSFLSGYYHKLHYLDRNEEKGYFKRLEKYLGQYYTGEYGTWNDDELNEEKIEEDFRWRNQGDKRYKTEEEIQKGVQGDIDRIKKYHKALRSFDEYLAQGVVTIENTVLLDGKKEDVFKGKGCYSINVGANEEAQAKLVKYISYQTTYMDEDNKEQVKQTAADMQVCLFDSGEVEACRYEGLVYLMNFLDMALA